MINDNEIIRVENLSFKYKTSNKILDNISFSLQQGSVNCLLGLNGSGKSTLLKILSGLIEGYQGEIFIDSLNLKGMTYKKRGVVFSYVGQEIDIKEDFLVLDYLLFSLANRKKFYERVKEEEKRKIKDIASNLEIAELLNKKLCNLSQGQLQKVLICAAIVQDTKIIFLDEPTSALDIKNQNMILKFIRKLAKEKNKTIIFSSHNPNHALNLNSDVLLVSDAKIREIKNSRENLQLSLLKEVYGENILLSKDLPYREFSFFC